MNIYDFAEPLDLTLWSDDSNFNKAINVIYEEICTHLGKSLKRNEELYKEIKEFREISYS